MDNTFISDPIVELKEVLGSDEANKLIQQGWLTLCVAKVQESDADGNNIYSNFKILLGLPKSIKDM